MIKKILLLLTGLMLSGVPVCAQSVTPATFGEVPDSLFSASGNPGDASYKYSLKKLHITFDEQNNSIIAVLHYHMRLKVFDASDKQASLVGIPYYFKNDIEHISDIKGYTYHSPSERIPLDAQTIKTININSRYNVKEFTMPQVDDGSVIEYTYTIRRKYIKELPDFFLANRVPTDRTEVSITYPNYLRYKGISADYKGPINHFIIKTDTSTGPKVFSYPQPPPVVTEVWRANDVPPVKKEVYISTIDDYRGKIKFQLSAFGIPRQSLENSWDYVVADIRRRQHLNRQIEANKNAFKIGKRIARSISDKKALQDSIFRYVSRRVRFSGSKTPFSSAADTAVLRGDPADQATINQTLAAILRGAGIEAYPMLISTRKSGQINRSFPSFFQFNGQLVYSKINGKAYFMDASFPYSRPNLIPVYMYNQTGLLLLPDRYRWVDIKPDESVISITVNVDAQLDRQGNLSGSMTAVNAGYPARKIRQQNARGTTSSQIIKNTLLQGYPQVNLSQAQVRRDSTGGKVKLSAHFSIKNYARSFRDGLDYRPMMVGYLQQNPFETKKRKLPVTLNAPEHLKFHYTIALPRGISSPPNISDRITALPGASFKEQYQNKSHRLRYNFDIDISQNHFSTDLFPRLLILYRRWVQLSRPTWHLGR